MGWCDGLVWRYISKNVLIHERMGHSIVRGILGVSSPAGKEATRQTCSMLYKIFVTLQSRLQRRCFPFNAIIEDDLGICEKTCVEKAGCGLSKEESVLA